MEDAIHYIRMPKRSGIFADIIAIHHDIHEAKKTFYRKCRNWNQL